MQQSSIAEYLAPEAHEQGVQETRQLNCAFLPATYLNASLLLTTLVYFG